MRRGHPLPRLWMMTDERQGEALWPALDALPAGSGVVVRHYSLARTERRALIARVRTIARRRGLLFVTAGSPALAIASKADGFHERSARIGPAHLLRTMSAHNETELVTAERAGADLVFVSPVFSTRSHPGAATLGPRRLARLTWQTDIPVAALGGMTAERAQHLRSTGIYGWAAIGALTPNTKNREGR